MRARQSEKFQKSLIFSFPDEIALFYKAGPVFPHRVCRSIAFIAGENNFMETAYSRAYRHWFSDYEAERRRRHKRPGAHLAGFPDPPTNPADIAAAVDTIGPRVVLETLQIHRSTLARWLSGHATIPRAAWLVLVMMADGRLPGMSAAWRDFRFIGDRLCLVGTRHSWTAHDLAGLPYLAAHADALAAQVAELRRQNARLIALGDFAAANDPIIRTG